MIKYLILLIFISGKVEEKILERTLKTVEIIYYKPETNIHNADSIKALAMLLNRECPECTFEEKVHVASCVVTGSRSLNISWKVYLFEKKQFWGFKHSKITYQDSPNHRENLRASIAAWTKPYKVRFYASEGDTETHLNKVKKKGYRKQGFFHYFTY